MKRVTNNSMDAGRRIARIDYDCLNNPVRIQFTDGNVTRYIYSPCSGGFVIRPH